MNPLGLRPGRPGSRYADGSEEVGEAEQASLLSSQKRVIPNPDSLDGSRVLSSSYVRRGSITRARVRAYCRRADDGSRQSRNPSGGSHP